MRPRSPEIATTRRRCDRCGQETDHRQHRVGRNRDGSQKYRDRCMPCHAERRVASRLA